MAPNKKIASLDGSIILFLVLVNALIAKMAFMVNQKWYWTLLITIPLLLVAVYGGRNRKPVL